MATTPATSAGISPQLPDVGIPGVNDPTCRSIAHPVILLHGTFSDVAANFNAMIPRLIASHRCVFGLNYGYGGVGPVTVSAKEFTTLVDQVRQITGAEKVDVIAYSQGGLVLRTALRLDGPAPYVGTAVLIAPSFHGTTTRLATSVPATLCPACADQAVGSTLLNRLDKGGDLDDSVRYAVVSTADDTVVTPVSSQVPQGGADRVSAILVQDQCPADVISHTNLPAAAGVISWVIAALDSDGRPDPSALVC